MYRRIHLYGFKIGFTKDQILKYTLENSEDNIKNDHHDKVTLIFEELVKVCHWHYWNKKNKKHLQCTLHFRNHILILRTLRKSLKFILYFIDKIVGHN